MAFTKSRVRAFATLAVFLATQPPPVNANVCVSTPLKPIRHFCGIVVAATGEPIPNTRLSIFKDGTEVGIENTDEKGRFDFKLNRPGEYEVHVDAMNFKKMSFRLKLSRPDEKCKGTVVVQLAIGGDDCGDFKFVPAKRS
jgi:hypothetical protein